MQPVSLVRPFSLFVVGCRGWNSEEGGAEERSGKAGRAVKEGMRDLKMRL